MEDIIRDVIQNLANPESKIKTVYICVREEEYKKNKFLKYRGRYQNANWLTFEINCRCRITEKLIEDVIGIYNQHDSFDITFSTSCL